MPTTSQTAIPKSHSGVGAREREMLSTLAAVFTDIATDVFRTELGGIRNETGEVQRLLQGMQDALYTAIRLQWQSMQRMEEIWAKIEEWGVRFLPPNQEKDLSPPSSPSNSKLESRMPPQSHKMRSQPPFSNPQPPPSNPRTSTHHASDTQHQAANPQPHANTQNQYAAAPDPPPLTYTFSPMNPLPGEDENLRNIFDDALLQFNQP
ncbi:uncharacterized protein PAC_17124 [Phialocephala subalpina]|uniref:Uncharacterized protein n=1 Tax=Phialocephala subalpina TaxID=576137 RepID=A0A1L7XQD4_9HELO|nr:uncharacterized protein PAC_17124 [Phialocephala subalpina]